jgi:hypothetical protein
VPALAALAALAVAAACARPVAVGGPRLTARWTGSDTSAFSAPVVGEWCAPLRLLQIRAVIGDTGLALATYPGDSVRPGAYPIRRADVADTVPPPAAAAAVRWFSKTVVQGYSSDSGRLMLRRSGDGALAGDFKAWAHAAGGTDHIVLTGSFDGLRTAAAPADCAGRAQSDSLRADSLEQDDDAGDGVD